MRPIYRISEDQFDRLIKNKTKVEGLIKESVDEDNTYTVSLNEADIDYDFPQTYSDFSINQAVIKYKIFPEYKSYGILGFYLRPLEVNLTGQADGESFEILLQGDKLVKNTLGLFNTYPINKINYSQGKEDHTYNGCAITGLNIKLGGSNGLSLHLIY